MADVIPDSKPGQIIKSTYGEIPQELVNVEKVLEEAGLSGAGPERPKQKRYTGCKSATPGTGYVLPHERHI